MLSQSVARCRKAPQDVINWTFDDFSWLLPTVPPPLLDFISRLDFISLPSDTSNYENDSLKFNMCNFERNLCPLNLRGKEDFFQDYA